MKKSALIGQCLVKARIASSIEGGLGIFYKVWNEFFKNKDLASWDTHVPEWVKKRCLEAARKSTKINVKNLIEDLTEPYQMK